MLFLKNSSEYKKIYREHKRIKGRYFTILLQRRKHEDGPAFGIVIRKKVGNAVTRNLIKRRIRSFIRDTAKQIPKNIYGVIIAADSAGSITWKETVGDIVDCLRVAGIRLSEQI